MAQYYQTLIREDLHRTEYQSQSKAREKEFSGSQGDKLHIDIS